MSESAVLGQCDICGEDVTDEQDRIAWACGSVVHGPCEDALTADIDIVHIQTEEGCVISMNGQGHLPCTGVTTRPTFTLSWTDPDEASEVAYVLRSAALDEKGNIRDHGFLQDSNDLFEQIEAWRVRKLSDD